MKKKILSVILLSVIAIPNVMVQYIGNEVYSASENNLYLEYTSALNPVKPSEASNDYVIKFEDEELKELIIKTLSLKKEIVTVEDISKLNILNFNLTEKREISIEGMQYAKNLTRFTISGAKYTEGLMEPIKGIKLDSTGLNGFDFEEVPEISAIKNVPHISFSDNNISHIDNILYYSNLKKISLDNNNIEDISVFQDYYNLESITMSGNRVLDLSPLIASSEVLSLIDFRNNRLENKGIESLFRDREFPKLERKDIRLSKNRITDFSSLDRTKPQNIWLGKQHVIVPVENKEFNLVLKKFYRKQREYLTEVVNLDETDDLVVLEEGSKYSISKTALEKDIIYAYWDKAGFNSGDNSPQEVRFSGLAEIVNLIPLNNLINNAENSKKPSDYKLALDKISYLRNEIGGSISEGLDQKLSDAEQRLNTIDLNEYKSIANPITESRADDGVVVKFVDEIFETTVKNAIKRTTGEHKEVVTVGDMRKLKEINEFLDGEVIDNKTPRIRSLEGIQYAVNLEGLNVSFWDLLLDSKYDENGNLVSNYFHDKYGYDGNTYTRNKYRTWGTEALEEVNNMHSGILKPLKGLHSLNSILFNHGNIGSKDIEDIQHLENIKYVQIYSAFITDLTPFSKYNNLESLQLHGNFISNIEPLADNKNLKKLYLSNNSINDWKPLEELQLVDLNLSEVISVVDTEQINKNINYISNISTLENLKIGRNFIESVEPLQKLERLKHLQIMYNHITDMSPLKNILENFGLGYFGTPDLEAYGQEYVVILDNGNYEFSSLIKNVRGDIVPLELSKPKDTGIVYTGNQKYKLIDTNSILETRKWEGNIPGISFNGYINVINKNRIREIVETAKAEPTAYNIQKALDSLEVTKYILSEKEYRENALSELNALAIQVNPESVSLNKSKLDLKEGNKEKLTATISPADAVNKDIEWSSSNANIAKVDAQGNVEAVAEGKATITAKVKGTDISAKAEVTVTKDTVVEPETDIKATSVRLNASSAELKKDDTYQLRATVNPNNSTQKDIEWTSTNSSVATVDSNGLVKAVGEGKATIRARVKGTEVSATATVTVKADEKPVKAESIELDASKVDMQVEQKEKLVATVKPDKAENKEVEWSSSDENVVKVDSEGNLEAVGAGTAKVTAKVKGTDITAEAEIVVTERAKPIDTTTKFTDINNHWAKAFIEHAFARGLFKGTTETLFSPETNMTRGMFVTVLGRLAGETAEPNDKFSDVNSEAYYAEYIAWAEENEIVEGYGNGKFGPDNNVTREEMAAIIQRYMDYKEIELEDNNTEEFRDAGDISDWAKESVTKIQKAGIIEGKGNGVFDPQANSTRAEVATLLIRMIEKYID